jgi:hypothetical protein
MYQRVLNRLREKIRLSEMDADGLSVFDVEHCILVGQIVERQTQILTRESKYRIRGHSVAGQTMETIAKVGPTGKLVIITVYLI